ncbi:MAG TPA: hypothetical protein DEQ40_06870 [Oxalobacteraceae bacterium]|jgi:phage shock protein A|nr:hypothetical protein [Oxalobacteraceae bacterium]
MLQVNEIKQRFNQIERTIGNASSACQADTAAPAELKTCLQQLDQESEQVREALQANDESGIRQHIDSMELLGDRAEQALKRAGKVDDKVKSAVRQAHNELSNLKHQLH